MKYCGISAQQWLHFYCFQARCVIARRSRLLLGCQRNHNVQWLNVISWRKIKTRRQGLPYGLLVLGVAILPGHGSLIWDEIPLCRKTKAAIFRLSKLSMMLQSTE